MDAQLKKGIVEVCVLVALQERDSYGYQIIKDVSPIVEIPRCTPSSNGWRLEGVSPPTPWSTTAACASTTA